MGAAFIGTEFVGERLPLDGIEYTGVALIAAHWFMLAASYRS